MVANALYFIIRKKDSAYLMVDIKTIRGILMKKQVFKGAATALITPMTENGVDFNALERIVDYQITEGIDALVICGTTGEKSTLDDNEHRDVLRCAVSAAAKRVPIIAGTGSNDTAHAVWMTQEAAKIGCDAMLVCTPYYNKTTQSGLIKMFETIADSSDKPVIVYNVPSRTGVGIEPETYLRLSEHPLICGIKEANGDISKIAKTAALVGDKLDIYSGNDDQIVPILSLGGMGVISVLSNILPKQTSEICKLYFEGKIKDAAALQLKYIPLINALFSEVNPIPIKSAMAAMGFCENYVRLPLVPMEPQHEAVMLGIMKKLGII